MPVYCLKPIKTDHASWPASCIGSEIEWAKVWASDCDEARSKVARATDVPELELPRKPANHKYGNTPHWESPWEIQDVTLCELDTSGSKPGDDILLPGGRRLPRKQPVYLGLLHNSAIMRRKPEMNSESC